MSTFDSLITDLRRDAQRVQPTDALQFCANWFQHRLEEQRSRTRKVLASYQLTAPNGVNGVQEPLLPHDHFIDNPFDGAGIPPSSSINLKPTPHRPFGTLDVPGNALLPHQANKPITFNVDGIRPDLPPSDPIGPMNPGDFLHPPASTLGRRTSVSAETIHVNSSSNEPLPFFPKTSDQLRRIKQAISGNFIFRDIGDEQLKSVLGAMEETRVGANEVVIRQGDTGDYFYVVEEGLLQCFIKNDPVPPASLTSHNNAAYPSTIFPPGYHPDFGKQVAECKPGDQFGELALMYGHPRAATVLSTEPCVLWRLDRITFRTIILKAAHRRRTMYEHFLSTVPLLQALLPEERSKIADSLISRVFNDGEAVVQEGEMGDSFFIVEEGEGVVTKREQGEDGEWRDVRVNSVKKGDYFGELSLLRLAPRAATVSAVQRTDPTQKKLKVAALKAPAFTRLLGPLRELMERNAGQSYSTGPRSNRR
ncbi:camp-dependent protein kinase regulatory subunit [Sistotremastrum niveocremeum HHB9708]|uniref:cAMP-dependent protein kinase regulatory subunit n=1 Tax=Sistotremastrum niveocremeum HHB9708 TaxID=1314777 RepID=A0A164Z4B0_9AGAM|nr:camp-dependent protein kinase regulatory subunit [Sistotremastrum niveocremeum HHB9708]